MVEYCRRDRCARCQDYIPDIATGAMATPVNRALHLCDGFCMPQWNATIHTLSFVILGCIPNAGLITIPKTFYHNLYQISNLKSYTDQTTMIQIPNISSKLCHCVFGGMIKNLIGYRSAYIDNRYILFVKNHTPNSQW